MMDKNQIEAAISSALEVANARIAREVLGGVDPKTRLGDLLDTFTACDFGAELRAITLGELPQIFGASEAPVTIAKRSTKKKEVPVGPQRNTRTKEGRDEFDGLILSMISSLGSARAEAIRHEVGGSSAQVRDALNRLIERRFVVKSGQRRATEYHLG